MKCWTAAAAAAAAVAAVMILFYVPTHLILIFIPGPCRDEVRCREKWTNVLDPNSIDTSPFTEEEDTVITQEAQKFTDSDVAVGWAKIASLLPGRTDSQCLRRWKDLSGPARAKQYVEGSKKRRAITVPRHSR